MKNKPSWAKYKARDKDGFYYFFSLSPKPRSTGWVSGGIKCRVDRRVKRPFKHENWPNTLEPL